jgi:hypothetical protein
MTIIVKHKRTGNEYILLGINGTGEKTHLSPRFLTDLFSQESSVSSSLMTVCDARGNIFFADIEELLVLEIDGKKPSEILPEITVSSFETQDRLESDFDDEFEADQNNFDDKQSEAIPTLSQERTNNNDFDDDEDWI